MKNASVNWHMEKLTSVRVNGKAKCSFFSFCQKLNPTPTSCFGENTRKLFTLLFKAYRAMSCY